jgi:hypothetical protein
MTNKTLKAKLTTANEDYITVILKDVNYEDYQELIDSNVYFFDGNRNEAKWNLIQFEDGVLHWWNSEEIEYI